MKSHQTKITVELKGIGHATPVQEIGDAVVQTILRTNDLARVDQPGTRCFVVRNIVADLEILDLTDQEAMFLAAAEQTGYLRGPTFNSPAEVRACFSKENVGNVLPPVADPIVMENLAAIAEVIIKARSHCDF